MRSLTDEENEVINLLAEAYNKMNALSELHPNHMAEFTRSIHECQRIVIARPYRDKVNLEQRKEELEKVFKGVETYEVNAKYYPKYNVSEQDFRDYRRLFKDRFPKGSQWSTHYGSLGCLHIERRG